MYRVKQVDDYMERLFGKPNYSKSFLDKHGLVRTPMGDGSKLIWRIDLLERFLQEVSNELARDSKV